MEKSSGRLAAWEVPACAGLTVAAVAIRFLLPPQCDLIHSGDNGQLWCAVKGVLEQGYIPTYTVIEPLAYYIIALFLKLSSFSYVNTVAVISLFGALTVPLMYAVARKLYGPWGALGASVLVAFNYWHIALGRSMLHDVLSLFLAFLAFASAVHWARRPGLGRALLCGTAFAVATQSRLSGAAYLFSAAVLVLPELFRGPRRKRLGLILQGAIVLAVPIAVWFAYNMGYYAIAYEPPALADSSRMWLHDAFSYACTAVFKWYRQPAPEGFAPSPGFIPAFLYHELGAVWCMGLIGSVLLSLGIWRLRGERTLVVQDLALLVAPLVLSALSYRTVFLGNSNIPYHNQLKIQLVALPVYALLLGAVIDKLPRLSSRPARQWLSRVLGLGIVAVPICFSVCETFRGAIGATPIYLSSYTPREDCGYLQTLPGAKTWHNGTIINVPVMPAYFDDLQRCMDILSAMPIQQMDCGPDTDFATACTNRGRLDGAHRLSIYSLKPNSPALCWLADAAAARSWLPRPGYLQFEVGGMVIGLDKRIYGDLPATVKVPDTLAPCTFTCTRSLGLDFLGGWTKSQACIPGQDIPIACYWRVANNVAEDLSFQWQLLDDQRRVISAGDAAPYAGWRPPQLWRVGEVIEQAFIVPVRSPAVLRTYGLRLVLSRVHKDGAEPISAGKSLAVVDFPPVSVQAANDVSPVDMNLADRCQVQQMGVRLGTRRDVRQAELNVTLKALADIPATGRLRFSLAGTGNTPLVWESSLANEWNCSTRFLSDQRCWHPVAYWWGVLHDVEPDWGVIAVGGKPYGKGIVTVPEGGTRPFSQAIYSCGDADVLRADCGVSDRAEGRGSVTFEVHGRSQEYAWSNAFQSGIVRHEVIPIDIPIRPYSFVRLFCTDAGDGVGSDHATWADARLLTARGPSVLYRDQALLFHATIPLPETFPGTVESVEIQYFDGGVPLGNAQAVHFGVASG